MFCIFKVTFLSEFRRFSVANLHLDNLKQDIASLSFDTIHAKVCPSLSLALPLFLTLYTPAHT